MAIAALIPVSMSRLRLQRITHIVTHPTTLRLGPAARFTLTATALATLAIPILLGQATATPPTPPDLQTTTGGKVQFDVASVKPNKTGPRGDPWHTSVSLDPEVLDSPTNGILSTTNTPLISLMAFAYKISRVQMMALQSSLPEWAFSDGYNVEARADHTVTREQMRPMMQSLLEERFHIKVHYDMREVPVYAIVQVKPGTFGPHLQPHPPDAPCATEWPSSPEGEKPARPDGPGIYPFLCNRFTRMNPSQPDRRKEGGRNVSIPTLGLLFFDFGNLDRPVIDGTGLKGNVDFVIEFSFEPPPGADSQAPPPSGPSFQVALRDQLGLKLVPQKAPFPFLVVDHVERPTPQNEAQLTPPHPATSTPARQPTLQRASFSPAQSPPITAKPELPAKPIAFEVVSIRPSNPNPNPDPRRQRGIGLRLTDDGLIGSNLSLLRFLFFEHPDLDFSSDRILGAPDWANTDTWDIQAKVADSDVPEWSKISHDNSPASMQRRRAALDAFLADRFKLKTHYETREGITYALVVAKGGLKLKPSSTDKPPSMRIIMGTGHREYTHASISSLTLLSTQELGHPVIDETGLEGKYDFTLDWASSSPPPTDNPAPDLTTALQDQLGLKLEPRKGPIQYLVIDHADHPSAN